MTSVITLFPNRSHSGLLRVRMSTYGGGAKIELIANSKKLISCKVNVLNR